MQQGGQKRP